MRERRSGMDLWIRSQDKHLLAKYNMLAVAQITPIPQAKVMAFVSDDLGYQELGAYKTKERALEVLDEIQNFLTPRFIVSANSDNDCIENLFDKLTCGKAFPDDKLQIKNINRDCWVYEMPQE